MTASRANHDPRDRCSMLRWPCALGGCRVVSAPTTAAHRLRRCAGVQRARSHNLQAEDGWKAAQPSDQTLRGNWWTLFNDPQLNTLEAQIDPANQTLKEAEANFRAARAAFGLYRANEAPTLSIGAVRRRDSRLHNRAVCRIGRCLRRSQARATSFFRSTSTTRSTFGAASAAPSRRAGTGAGLGRRP